MNKIKPTAKRYPSPQSSILNPQSFFYKLIKITTFSLLILCSQIPISSATASPLIQRDDVKAFIEKMVAQYHFDRIYLEHLFSTISINDQVIHQSKHIKEDEPWYLYKSLFLNQERLAKGVSFWKNHQRSLDYAEKQFGVPPYIIVAILGIETNYGHNLGQFPVIESLSTLAFTPNPRATFFEEELKDFLILCRKYRLDPLTIYGSRSGAIGWHQFMPTSFLKYQVNLQPSTEADIIHDSDNAVVSIAHFLHAYGWIPHGKVAIQVSVNPSHLEKLPAIFMKKMTANQLASYGVQPAFPLAPETEVILFPLQEKNGQSYWIGFNNLRVLGHYNTHLLYALAAVFLGKRIENAYANALL